MAGKGSVNKAIIVGNLGADPELRTLPSGDSVVNLSVATTESWADKNNPQAPRVEKTEWHRVAFFGKQAEIIQEYMRKGSKIYVEGSLTTRKWQDKDGNDRWTTEIRGRDFTFLSARGEGGAPSPSPSGKPQTAPADDDFGGMDDIPF